MLKTKCCFYCVLCRWFSVCLCKLKMVKRWGAKNTEQKKSKLSLSKPKKASSHVSTKKEIDLKKDNKSTKGKISSNNADTTKKNESRKNSSASIRSNRSIVRGSISSIRSNRSIVRESKTSIRSNRSIVRDTLSPDSKTKNLTQESKNNIKSTNSLNPTYNHSNGYFKDFLPFWYYDPSSYYHRYPYPSDCFQPYSFMTSHLAPSYIDCNPRSPCNPCMSLPSTTKICDPMNPCTIESVHKLATNLAAKIIAEHKQKKKLKKKKKKRVPKVCLLQVKVQSMTELLNS